MSEATLRAVTSIVLSSGAIPKVNFRIEGYQVYAECFTRLKSAVRNGEMGIEINDPYLKRIQAFAAYNGRSDTMFVQSSVVQSTAISREARAAIIHECLHAVLDMDYVQGLSPYEEETCGALVSNIYILHHFGTPFFSANGNATRLARQISANPGIDITNNPTFRAMYEQVAQIYAADDPDSGKKPGLHNGLRKRL